MVTAFFVFAIGACVGSFLSAILHRTRYGGSMVTGRSACVSCCHRLGPGDLVPIASWLWRRGRCRYCRARVSWQYLALELAMGGLFLAAFLQNCGFGEMLVWSPCVMASAKLFVFLPFLALIFVYDARHGEIPDAFSVTGLAAALIFNISASPGAWPWYLLAVAVGAAFFGIQYVLSKGKWIGDGDILVGAMVGAMVGWPNVIMALFASYVIGLAVVMALLLSRKKTLADTVPMGPFLALGACLLLFYPAIHVFSAFYAFI